MLHHSERLGFEFLEGEGEELVGGCAIVSKVDVLILAPCPHLELTTLVIHYSYN